MKFLERFTELIKEKNLSITEIAQKTNLPRTTISSYINNRKSIPSAVQLEVLANFFNVSIDYLVGREDDFGNVVVSAPNGNVSPADEKLLKDFSLLGPHEQEFIRGQIKFLLDRDVIKK